MVDISDKILAGLSMSERQARVYVAALELGEDTIHSIARKSGVNRSTIYTFLEEMRSRGFLTETRRGKRRLYGAIHPEHLVAMQESQLSAIESVLPELLAIHNQSRKKPRVTFYEGERGLEEVYADMLRDKKEICAYEDLDSLKVGVPERLFASFPKERARRGILIRSISRDTPLAREFSKHNRGLLRETKFLDAPELKTDINIYGNKVALMDLRSKPPMCVVIENVSLAETMRITWRALWERLGSKIG